MEEILQGISGLYGVDDYTFTNNDWADRDTIGYGRMLVASMGYRF